MTRPERDFPRRAPLREDDPNLRPPFAQLFELLLPRIFFFLILLEPLNRALDLGEQIVDGLAFGGRRAGRAASNILRGNNIRHCEGR